MRVCLRGVAGAATSTAPARVLTTNSFKIGYSPGTIRWAVVVPAFMIHTPPLAA